MTRVTEIELQAFVDDELSNADRVHVLDHLLQDPQACTQVLLDLRSRDLLRALRDENDERPSVRILTAAERLQRHVRQRGERRPVLFSAKVIAATGASAVALMLIAFSPHEGTHANAAIPNYLAEAVVSQRTALLRQAMPSQPEAPLLDPSDIRAATQISVPKLPRNWRIVDVQLFPSDYGPSLQVSIRNAQDEPLSLFATFAPTGAPARPTTTQVRNENLIAWAREGNTYVLTGNTARDQLMSAAQDLADNQNS